MRAITGSFFDIIHHNTGQSAYWHEQVIAYRDAEWHRFMEHMAESGIDTVILIGTVCHGKSLFPDHPFLPQHECLTGYDPIEAALCGADAAGLEFFMGLGFQEQYSHEIHYTPEAVERTARLAETLLNRYAQHKSFNAWYIADEFGFNEHGCFNEDPVKYVENVSKALQATTPGKKRLISPYFHLNCGEPCPGKVREQITEMQIDYLGIQNGATKPHIGERHFVKLRDAFEKLNAKLWGNVELFVDDSKTDGKYNALVSGDFATIKEQMSWIEPYADKLISYQLMGLMNNIGLGKQPESADLWKKYTNEFVKGVL